MITKNFTFCKKKKKHFKKKNQKTRHGNFQKSKIDSEKKKKKITINKNSI